MNENNWHMPNGIEQRTLEKAERNVMLERIVLETLFVVVTFGVLYIFFFGVRTAQKEYAKTVEESNYLAGFAETEESIINELYGDRTTYADNKTWHAKTDFLDKEKTAETGEITYDEEAFAKYYDSFLEEYDAMIDHDNVAALLEERKSIYQETKKAALASDGTAFIKSGKGVRLYILLGICIVLELGICFGAFWKFYLIHAGKYMVCQGRIVDKVNRYDRFRLLKRFAVVSINGSTERVRLSILQSMALGVGESVYLAKLESGILVGKTKNVICRM